MAWKGLIFYDFSWTQIIPNYENNNKKHLSRNRLSLEICHSQAKTLLYICRMLCVPAMEYTKTGSLNAYYTALTYSFNTTFE
jgi:hypothetical protein